MSLFLFYEAGAAKGVDKNGDKTDNFVWCMGPGAGVKFYFNHK